MIPRDQIILRKKTLIPNFVDKYMYWLIPKITSLAKVAKLISQQLRKIIVKKDMIAQKKEVFTKMFYNKEVILA